MRILVLGAGVLGSYLAHVLVRGGNEVTVLARTARAEQLRQDGLVIRHYFQRKTTVDQVKVIETLESGDVYDLIFVVMKYNDFRAVLPVLAENLSRNIVLVGNNADAHGMLQYFQEHSRVPQNIIFGFQLSGGMRETDGRVICIRAGGQMVLGSLTGEVTFKPVLDQAFKGTKYKLLYEADMNAWLLSHIVPIVALNSLTYLHEGNLSKIFRDKVRLKQAVTVMDEGFAVLEKLGYRIIPAAPLTAVRRHPKWTYHGLRLIHKLPFMKLIDGSFSEIEALLHSFEGLKKKAKLPAPAWDHFRKETSARYTAEKR
ncbi:2-dehydropantoate 2-reductase N-terminal domain-containing protein [Paenibacillus sp. MMS20-IR301]|uniref:ketopantoate reductase family protein n=1 Tax=Paenibacillus sp. MMS20-IR301 TaxID=2895946 RepID=UPI0028E22406|nr:2-dehydropantoate 2-reductase N-terminal domain-containing protein [Paenibacillus sp. MMS20-IR301]WNS45342.1 2-dehydropantoate 2-reductase N-terminal domain-containing protein [Paenibacillus sp. MMS20-IR301]